MLNQIVYGIRGESILKPMFMAAQAARPVVAVDLLSGDVSGNQSKVKCAT